MPSYIYVLDRIPPGQQGYKVGITISPKKRWAAYKTSLPEGELCLCWPTEHATLVERRIKARFVDQRVPHDNSLSEVIYADLLVIMSAIVEEIKLATDEKASEPSTIPQKTETSLVAPVPFIDDFTNLPLLESLIKANNSELLRDVIDSEEFVQIRSEHTPLLLLNLIDVITDEGSTEIVNLCTQNATIMQGTYYWLLRSLLTGKTSTARQIIRSPFFPQHAQYCFQRFVQQNFHQPLSFLLSNSSDQVDPTEDNNSAIYYSMLEGRIDIVRVLLKDQRVRTTINTKLLLRYTPKSHHSEIKELRNNQTIVLPPPRSRPPWLLITKEERLRSWFSTPDLTLFEKNHQVDLWTLFGYDVKIEHSNSVVLTIIIDNKELCAKKTLLEAQSDVYDYLLPLIRLDPCFQ